MAEHFLVLFYLDGDVIPDERLTLKLKSDTVEAEQGRTSKEKGGAGPLDLSALDDKGRPIFALRGIQPFHDFPEGPDWWNRDDYLAIISQLPKLRMNFFALHTYPEDRPNAEHT